MTAARELVSDRAPHDFLVEPDHVGLDRQAILGRRLDDRHVADAGQRHVQRPRNRRRRHRQDVDALLELLDALLVGDAEALLFVHDQQPQVAELDVLRQQPVGADDDLDLPCFQVIEGRLLLRLRAEAAHHVNPDRKRREAIGERLQVLERQDGRRSEDRHLLAVHHCLERRAHRHFRLAVADVAAEQAVHRRRRLHVALDVGDGVLLIDRQLPLECVLELLLPVAVRTEGVTGDGFARGVELEQLLRHIAHLFLDPRLRLLPRRPAKLVQRGAGRPGVLLDEIEPLDRDEELIFAGISELHELLRLEADLDLLQADEDADAIVHVDDEIAHLQIAEIR